jgi:hypothetical protein
MVSVLLLTVSLMTVAVLVVRSSHREVSQANALVARERGLMAAQAAIELGAAQLRLAINQGGSSTVVINHALTGYNNAGAQDSCTSAFEDCIPGGLGDSSVPHHKRIAGSRQIGLYRTPACDEVQSRSCPMPSCSDHWVQVPPDRSRAPTRRRVSCGFAAMPPTPSVASGGSWRPTLMAAWC